MKKVPVELLSALNAGAEKQVVVNVAGVQAFASPYWAEAQDTEGFIADLVAVTLWVAKNRGITLPPDFGEKLFRLHEYGGEWCVTAPFIVCFGGYYCQEDRCCAGECDTWEMGSMCYDAICELTAAGIEEYWDFVYC